METCPLYPFFTTRIGMFFIRPSSDMMLTLELSCKSTGTERYCGGMTRNIASNVTGTFITIETTQIF